MHTLNNLDLIEFHIVEHCNLNCKCCMHFSPLAPKKFVSIKSFKQDAKKMSTITKTAINNIHILGGEPLLHPELLKILKITRQYFPNSDIQLISNGILILSQKTQFWQTLKKYNIHLSVTRYPLELNYQQITHLTQKYNIKYTFYSPNKENSFWHFPLDLNGTQDPIYSYSNCRKGNNCTNINICDGKLYMCPVAGYIKYFNEYFNKDLSLCEEDYLKIKDIKTIDEIKEYISKPIPFCKYCDIDNRSFNNKWDITKREIQEWV